MKIIEEQIFKIYHWLNNLAVRPNKVSREELGAFFTEDIKIYTNGADPLIGIDNFLQHIEISLTRYKKSIVELPFRRMIISENVVTLYYFIQTLTIENEPFSFIVMSILEFDDKKVHRWWEVIVEKEKLPH